MKVLKDLLAKEVSNLPRRIMSSGGQNHSYIKLDDVLAILGQDMDGNPEPENERPIRHCCVCLSEQLHTPSGWTCKNGHGAAESVE
jgi:hypothetical protein